MAHAIARPVTRRCFLRQMTMGAGLAVFAPTIRAASKADIIRRENEHPGTADWLLAKLQPVAGTTLNELCQRRRAIEAFCSHASIRPGETLTVFVSTDPPSRFQADIFRLGYYGGKGARRVMSVHAQRAGVVQPTPGDGPKNVIECRWSPSLEIKIPAHWVSGVYLGLLTAERSGFQAYFIFIVRDDRRADFLFQCSDLTWQSYNRWPAWRSLYDYKDKKWHTLPGNDVSFDRPYSLFYNGRPAKFNPLTNGSGEFLLWEHPLCFWMEREGYDVTYVSNLDTHAEPKGLRRAKAFLSVGHDEYWTRQMFNNAIAARDAGVNLAFLSGNAVHGEIYIKPASDGRPHRIFGRLDTRGEDDNFPDEQELLGATSYGVGAADWICEAPDHWLFAGTNMKRGDRIPQLVGWEYHGPPFRDDPSLVVLAAGKVRDRDKQLDKTYAATIYNGPKGNIVFNAATCWWNMLLSRPPGAVNPPDTDFSKEDPRVQRITKNLLDRMKNH